MKKLFITLLILMCTIFSSACTKQEVVNDCIRNNLSLDSLQASMTLDIKLPEQDIPLWNFSTKACNLTTENPSILTQDSSMFYGDISPYTIYSDGEFLYISLSDDLNGIKVPFDSFKDDYDFISKIHLVLKPFPEEVISDITTKSNNNGSTIYSVTLSNTLFLEIFSELHHIIKNSIVVADLSYSLSDVQISITAQNGYVQIYDIAYSIYIDFGDGTLTEATIKTSLIFTEPGTPVTVTMPDNFENFADNTL